MQVVLAISLWLSSLRLNLWHIVMAFNQYRQAGRRLGAFIRSNNPTSQQIQGFLSDVLAKDDLLLASKDAASRPLFTALQGLAGTGSGALQRDALLQELSLSYLPRVVEGIKQLIDGMLDISAELNESLRTEEGEAEANQVEQEEVGSLSSRRRSVAPVAKPAGFIAMKFNPNRPMGRANWFVTTLIWTPFYVLAAWNLPGINSIPMPAPSLALLLLLRLPFWILDMRRARGASLHIGYIYIAMILVPVNLLVDGGPAEVIMDVYQAIVSLNLFFNKNRVEVMNP